MGEVCLEQHIVGANLINPTSLLSGLISGIESGQIQIPASGVLTVNASALGIGLQNTPSRIKSQTASLQYAVDQFSAVLSGFSTTQDNIAGGLPGLNNHLRQIGISQEDNYTFSDDLTGDVRFTYSDQILSVGHSSVGEFDLGGQYRLSDLTQLYADASYLKRLSNAALTAFSKNSGGLSITSFRIGIRHQF